jgi:hypothetical protein
MTVGAWLDLIRLVPRRKKGRLMTASSCGELVPKRKKPSLTVPQSNAGCQVVAALVPHFFGHLDFMESETAGRLALLSKW